MQGRTVARTGVQAGFDVPAAKTQEASLSLPLLVALVVGSITGSGSGIFGLPQNMAASAGAGAGAVLIGWAITACRPGLLLSGVWRRQHLCRRVGSVGVTLGDACHGAAWRFEVVNKGTDR